MLLIYTTRGCFHNPTRDRGRVIGEATVTSRPVSLTGPIVFGTRSFTIGCDLSIAHLVPYPQGVELAPLVPELEAFPDSASWSARMWRSLVPLPPHDVERLRGLLAPRLVERNEALTSYRAAVPTRTS